MSRLLLTFCLFSLSLRLSAHSPHSSVCRYSPVRSECSPAPERASSERSPPPDAWLRSPPADTQTQRNTKSMSVSIHGLKSHINAQVRFTWQCSRSICSLLPLGRFWPGLSTVDRRSWASAKRAWVLFRSLLSFFSTSKSLWPTCRTFIDALIRQLYRALISDNLKK